LGEKYAQKMRRPGFASAFFGGGFSDTARAAILSVALLPRRLGAGRRPAKCKHELALSRKFADVMDVG